MSISVTLEGSAELQRRLANLPREARRVVQLEVRRTLTAIQQNAKRRAPVRSGRLRDSITYELNDDATGGSVFADVPYAAFVELGTSRMPAQPFLFPAIEEEQAAFEERLRAELDAAFQRAGR